MYLVNATLQVIYTLIKKDSFYFIFCCIQHSHPTC